MIVPAIAIPIIPPVLRAELEVDTVDAGPVSATSHCQLNSKAIVTYIL